MNCGIFPTRERRESAITQRAFLVAGFACLLAVSGPSTIRAAAPIIESLTPSSFSAEPGASITLTVQAYDPDCGLGSTCEPGGFGACGKIVEAQRTAWSAAAGTFPVIDNGSDGSPYSATADWQAPDTEGIYTLSVSVSDLGGGSLCFNQRETTTATVDVQVVAAPQSNPPVIDTLTAGNQQLWPGDSTSLTCLATDPDGDPITYTWETTRGVITPSEGSSVVLQAGLDPGVASVTCTATDPFGAFESSSLNVSVISAVAERAIFAGMIKPQRLSVDSLANLYVADSTMGGISVISLYDGELLYQIALPQVTSIEVDWADQLLVGTTLGATVTNRIGVPLLSLESGASLGDVADVAVDRVNQRYGVLHRRTGRVVIYDASGNSVAAFGSTGEAPDQFKTPLGLAARPDGSWVVADNGSGLLKVFSANGTYQNSLGTDSDFVQLADVAVDEQGILYASDSYQDWVISFNFDGTKREILGTYGEGVGEFKTPVGITIAQNLSRVLVASLNSASAQVFQTSANPTVIPGPNGLATPDFLDFGSQIIGESGVPQPILFSNTGGATLGIREIRSVGDFSETNECGDFLDPGESCTLSVLFQPTTVGTQAGALVIVTSQDPAGMTLAIQGEGIAPYSVIASISDAAQEVYEGDSEQGEPAQSLFPVSLSGPSEDIVSVDFLVVSGTATAGEDMEPGAGTVQFAPGETEQVIAVPLIDDAVLEPDFESFTVELSNPVNVGLGVSTGSGFVADDELCPSPNLLVNPGAEVLASGGAIFGWIQVGGTGWRILDVGTFEGENHFLAAPMMTAEMYQDVDVSIFAESIDAGNQLFLFEGYVRTDGHDRARLILDFLDELRAPIGGYNSGEVATAGWAALPVDQPWVAVAPPNTRTIRVRMQGLADRDGGTNARFDALTLQSLRKPTLSLDEPSVYEGDFGTAQALFSVDLACPFYQEVSASLTTADGTAVAGTDYLPAGALVTFATGDTAHEFAVDVVGDEVDEDHEAFLVNISLDSGEAVLLESEGIGLILNDDFCAQPVAFWASNADLWPIDQLTIGGVRYDRVHLEALLGYGGGDASTRLTRELVATFFNLELGSDPAVWSVIDAAEEFLVIWPAGSKPQGQAKAEAQSLQATLESYNSAPCEQ